MADGTLEPVEELKLKKYLTSEWGFAASFVSKMIDRYKSDEKLESYNDIIISFGAFINNNEDCDAEEIKLSVMNLLRQISDADGVLTEKEEIELTYIGNLLKV